MKVTLCVLSPFSVVSHFTTMRSIGYPENEQNWVSPPIGKQTIHFGAVVKEDEHTNNGHET